MLNSILATATATIRSNGLVVLGSQEDWATLSVHFLVANRHPLNGEGSMSIPELIQFNELDHTPSELKVQKLTFNYKGEMSEDSEANELSLEGYYKA